jgi:hypothetical protein
MGRPLIDITDQRFGRLVATSITQKFGRVVKHLCRCDCGKEVWQPTNHLTSGHAKSCGCLLGEFKKLPAGRAVRNQILDDYKRGAAKRNLIWALKDEEFDTLIADNCFYCGLPPYTVRRARRCNGDLIYNGIDRKNNDKGYSINNVVTCCVICNRAKGNMSFVDFVQWIENVKRIQ